MGSGYREKNFRYSRSAARRKGFLLGAAVVSCIIIYFYFRRSENPQSSLTFAEIRKSSFVSDHASLVRGIGSNSAVDNGKNAKLYRKINDMNGRETPYAGQIQDARYDTRVALRPWEDVGYGNKDEPMASVKNAEIRATLNKLKEERESQSVSQMQALRETYKAARRPGDNKDSETKDRLSARVENVHIPAEIKEIKEERETQDTSQIQVSRDNYKVDVRPGDNVEYKTKDRLSARVENVDIPAKIKEIKGDTQDASQINNFNTNYTQLVSLMLAPDTDAKKRLLDREVYEQKPELSAHVANATDAVYRNVVKEKAAARPNGSIYVPKTFTQISGKSYKYSNQSRVVTSNMTTVTQYVKDCIVFRTKFLNKTDTKICEQNLSTSDLFMEIMKDKVTWKMNHFLSMQAVARGDQKLAIIDIGCETGALPLLALNFTHTIIAVDQHVENLRILQRAIVAFGKLKQVHLLPYIVSNASVPKEKTDDNVPRTTLDVLALSHIKKDQSVVVLISQEGYELEALQGGNVFFKSYNVCAVVVKSGVNRLKKTRSKLIKLMDTKGFQTFRDPSVTTTVSSIKSSARFKSTRDIVFVSKSNKCASYFL